MKDSEFIELLNLYLDHEITAADAARLEAEVQGNPARRRVYQDYCRMQKACKMLAQDFAEENAEVPERNVVAFEQARAANRRRSIPYYVAGTFAAAAACVALVFVTRPHEPAGTTPVNTTAPVAVTAPTSPTATAVAVNEPAGAPRRGLERQSLNALSLRNTDNATLALTARMQNDPHFAWMKDVQLAPIQTPTPADQVRFDVGPALNNQNRTYSSGKPLPNDVQWNPVAFRFQK